MRRRVCDPHAVGSVWFRARADLRSRRTFNRFKMLQGRLADPSRSDELVASYSSQVRGEPVARPTTPKLRP
jgi:hypothetical protein